MFESILKYDIAIFNALNDRIKTNIFDKIIPYFTELGSWWFTITACLLIIVFGKGYTRMMGIEAATSLTISHLIVQGLKKKIGRKRPYLSILDANTLRKLWEDHSFPSGHTTAGFALAVSLSFGYPALYLAFLGLATMVGISRIYVGMHYPTDVLMGAAIGSGMSLLTHVIFV
ncbi:MAG: phosphatase PAP2 family protein [Thermoanaerobacteraceae bacterium]|nr:phosphatase PAP2 family protein [Thermoanaerobacteraceae bacterium]